MDILDYAEISSRVYKLEPISDNLLKLYIVDNDKYFNLFNLIYNLNNKILSTEPFEKIINYFNKLIQQFISLLNVEFTEQEINLFQNYCISDLIFVTNENTYQQEMINLFETDINQENFLDNDILKYILLSIKYKLLRLYCQQIDIYYDKIQDLIIELKNEQNWYKMQGNKLDSLATIFQDNNNKE